MRFSLPAWTLFAALSLPAAALADPVNFVFTPNGGSSYSFTLDPADLAGAASGVAFIFESVSVNGGPGDAIIVFDNPDYYSENSGSAYDFYIDDSTDGGPSGVYTGLQLYSGDEAAPTFLDGTYYLEQATLAPATVGPRSLVDGNGATLVITDQVSATPEPSSLILLGTGLVGIGGLARRRLFGRKAK